MMSGKYVQGRLILLAAAVAVLGACATVPEVPVAVEPVEVAGTAVPEIEVSVLASEPELPPPAALSIPLPAGVPNVIIEDTEWSGSVAIRGDVLIPEGRTLRIAAGTEIALMPAAEEHDEPGFHHPGPEIVVRGRLLSEGTPGEPVVFRYEAGDGGGPGLWGGILFEGGAGSLRHSHILQTDRGVLVVDASPTLEHVRIESVREGLVALGLSRPVMRDVTVRSGEGGLFCGSEAAPVVEDSDIRSSLREGLMAAPGCRPEIRRTKFSGVNDDTLWGFIEEKPAAAALFPEARVRALRMDLPSLEEPVGGLFDYEGTPAAEPASRRFTGDATIAGDAVWRGRIVVDGRITVGPEAELTIEPGTTVVFAFRDTDGDGIGESGLHVEGALSAAGEAERPIVFTAGTKRGLGLWDAVRIGGGGKRDSRISFAVVESSHRGIEGVGALLTITDSVFRQNGRGVGGKGSEVEIQRSTFTGNREGIGAFDSVVEVSLSRISGNGAGIRGDQSAVMVNYCVLDGNILSGVDLRYSTAALTGSFLRYNTPAVTSYESSIDIDGLRVLRNNLHGFLLQDSEVFMKFSMMGNGVGNGLTSDGSAVRIRRSTFLANLRHTLENESEDDLDAAVNVWFLDDRPVDDVIFDRNDDARLGYINIYPMRISLFDYTGSQGAE